MGVLHICLIGCGLLVARLAGATPHTHLILNMHLTQGRDMSALSYVAPLLSTLLLILFGSGDLTWVISAACLLIVGGAVLASKDMPARRPSQF